MAKHKGKKVVFKGNVVVPAKEDPKLFAQQQKEREAEDVIATEKQKELSQKEFKEKEKAGIRQSLPEGVKPPEEKRIITEREISLGLTQKEIDLGLDAGSVGTVSSAAPLAEALIGGGIIGAGLKSGGKLLTRKTLIQGKKIITGDRTIGFNKRVLKEVRNQEQRTIGISLLKKNTGKTLGEATRAWDAAGKKFNKWLISGVAISGLIVAKEVAEVDTMATWLVSDNILTTINMELNQLESNLIFNPELVEIDDIEGLLDKARRDSIIAEDFIIKSATFNPLLWVGRRRWRLNAKIQREAIENKIERILERA